MLLNAPVGQVRADPAPEPVMLAHGEHHVTFCRQFREPIAGGVKTLEVQESLGRRYRAPKKDVQEVNDFLKKLKARGQT